jgi:hypothetical protein
MRMTSAIKTLSHLWSQFLPFCEWKKHQITRAIHQQSLQIDIKGFSSLFRLPTKTKSLYEILFFVDSEMLQSE